MYPGRTYALCLFVATFGLGVIWKICQPAETAPATSALSISEEISPIQPDTLQEPVEEAEKKPIDS